ncbi:family 43 glycosylhydrolase [Pseudokineococcus lusitanus]|uniref:Glycosyl hydrolase family 43 n=1 Tax=Pseudokineococcus lusitanus TaxID=763993 RepID=A0A3N1HR51_9ACTN|nr:family 43 glycosylhydrolase [Pseudokineococcus lusitanus]ROP44985.1 glycosyl hydrolase family 43 [Pseudokineococcus lusitanus]
MSSHPRRLLTGLGGALLALALLGATPTTAAPSASAADARSSLTASRTVQPVVDANFADPDLLLVDGVYHAYATNSGGQNVQHRTSRNLRTWTEQPDVAPVLGDWVGECSFAPGGATDRCVWAPEVAAVDGGYALYYTARDEQSQRQCIGVSTSTSPGGPFVPVGDDPLVCPTAQTPPDLGGAIDAGTFVEDGQLWLLWKADGNCCSKPATLFVQPMSPDGTTFTGPATELIDNDLPWEGAVVEAPTLAKHDGTYYLFYSANDFAGGNYRTSYATATSITGPYTKAGTELMTSEMFAGDVRGSGGQDVITTRDGGTAIVFHGWDPAFSYRGMYASPLEWEDGVPVVTAAADRYELEDGTVTNARVVGDASASGGEKVGGLDFADSSVTVRVHSDTAARATLGIRYANGSTDGDRRVLATDTLTVNGRDAGTVTFRHTGWGNWQRAEARVKLQAGWNTVTLTKATYFAELDALYVDDRRLEPAVPVYPESPAAATRYEAEAGVVTNARVVGDAGASAGAKVGGLDFADSSVAVQIYAERAGRATLGIRFANGSERGGYSLEATHRISVGGADAGLVTYPHTRWGNWQTIEHDVTLAQGWNTVTLTRVSWFAEIDAVDVLAPRGR